MHIGSIERVWLHRLISGATSISATARQASRCNKRWRENERSMRNSLSGHAPWSDGCGRHATGCRTLPDMRTRCSARRAQGARARHAAGSVHGCHRRHARCPHIHLTYKAVSTQPVTFLPDVLGSKPLRGLGMPYACNPIPAICAHEYCRVRSRG